MSINETDIQELLSRTRYLEELSTGDLTKIAAIEQLEPGTVLCQEGHDHKSEIAP